MNRRTATVLVDALFVLLLVLVVQPHKPKMLSEPVVELFAPLIVGARWPDKYRADVDLWVKGPSDKPVGYSRKVGTYSNLWQDERGGSNMPERYELIRFHQALDGEYVVNIHLYSNTGGYDRLPVDVAVWSRTSARGYDKLWEGRVQFSETKEELTVVRFVLREEVLVPGSVHNTQVALRATTPSRLREELDE